MKSKTTAEAMPHTSRTVSYDKWAYRAATEYFGTPHAGDVLEEAQCRHLAHIVYKNRKPAPAPVAAVSGSGFDPRDAGPLPSGVYA